ncbi:sodium/hydrogen exchanger 9B2-like, partial [Hyalella azteca]|uniref:Sodium/hydrogen exchanger 9B2-like n=1 Tax=Hyalella azteca TaxID=294128 RepID=A0A8B7NVR3_HYAAZ
MELRTVGLGVALLLISMTSRALSTFFTMLGSGLNIRERFFVAIAWLPKATVQIALGSTALDYAIRYGADVGDVALAKQVQTFSWMMILFAAPVGAIATLAS